MASNPIQPMKGIMEHVCTDAVNTPHPADIYQSPLPHQKFAVSVTEQHGLQVKSLCIDPQTIDPHPYRAGDSRKVADLDSFIAELSRRPLDAAGTLWGNANQGRLTAIYNDHTTDDPGWRDDLLTLQLVADEDWTAWHHMSGQLYSQLEFGDLVQDLLHTVISPDQADLLEVIDSIKSSTEGVFESVPERFSGGQKLTYKVENTVRAGRTRELEIPRMIILELRPWDGHPDVYPVHAEFRVRIKDSQLSLGVKLKPTRPLIRAAWATLTVAVTEATGKPVYAAAGE